MALETPCAPANALDVRAFSLAGLFLRLFVGANHLFPPELGSL
jgi:hypothetical protein